MTKYFTVLATAALATLLAIIALTPLARADIFEWEYINPANPSHGKQQSTTLTPGGADVNAAPGAVFYYRDLTMAYLIGADLTGANAHYANLTNADLSQSNLTGANLYITTLTGANFANADVRGAAFLADTYGGIGGLTTAQLYSTASYAAHDLSGIGLSGNHLSGVNLVGQNLTGANFGYATLIGSNLSQVDFTTATFRHSNLTNANLSQANFENVDLSGHIDEITGELLYVANLTGANLSQANLAGANFSLVPLSGANLTGAEVRGASFRSDFGGTGLTPTQLYLTASYQAHDLTGVNLYGNDMSGANFAGQNLTNANFQFAGLTTANLAGTDVRGASFGQSITLAQLYSTASYQVHDLSGIGLQSMNLTGANLAGQNLSDANFYGATLTGANFTGSEVRGANFERYYTQSGGISVAQLYSTASYQAHDLNGIGLYGHYLTGANFSGQNLSNADFTYASLSAANFAGADVRGARFSDYGPGGFSIAQLYSTASYLAHDLTGIRLARVDLSGANLASQNLTNASLNATMTNADLSQANLTNASFVSGSDTANLTGANLSGANLTNAYLAGYVTCGEGECGIVPGANLTNANLSGADARGANFQFALLTGANTINLIQWSGHIAGLDLTAGASLVVRDYDGNPEPRGIPTPPPTGPLPIVIDQHLAMDATGTLRMVFDADAWDSTISFAPGIFVTRGGALELTFASDVNLASQVGRTIDLFDWTGVTPTGTFTVSSPYTWNLSNLYTTGEVTLTALPSLPGDFNGDGSVDAADFTVWRDGLGSTYTMADYDTWKSHFGQLSGAGSGADVASPILGAVPEPSSELLLILGAALGTLKGIRSGFSGSISSIKSETCRKSCLGETASRLMCRFPMIGQAVRTSQT